MAKKISKEDDTKLFAFLGVFLTVIGFIIVYAMKKDNKYAMYYGKQGLVLFIGWMAVWVLAMILFRIPIIGLIIIWAMYLVMGLLWVLGMIYALSGKMKPIPVIGQFADKINL